LRPTRPPRRCVFPSVIYLTELARMIGDCVPPVTKTGRHPQETIDA
jgi:hypothetical protein